MFQPLAEMRREPRVRVYWRGYLHLPAGCRLDVRVADISASGVGLMAGELIALRTGLPLTLGVPDLAGSGEIYAVQCNIKVAYAAYSAGECRIGATWVDLTVDARQILERWIDRLRFLG